MSATNLLKTFFIDDTYIGKNVLDIVSHLRQHLATSFQRICDYCSTLSESLLKMSLAMCSITLVMVCTKHHGCL